MPATLAELTRTGDTEHTEHTDTGSSATYAVERAAEAVDIAQRLAGGSAIFTRSPLERAFRDVHTDVALVRAAHDVRAGGPGSPAPPA